MQSYCCQGLLNLHFRTEIFRDERLQSCSESIVRKGSHRLQSRECYGAASATRLWTAFARTCSRPSGLVVSLPHISCERCRIELGSCNRPIAGAPSIENNGPHAKQPSRESPHQRSAPRTLLTVELISRYRYPPASPFPLLYATLPAPTLSTKAIAGLAIF